MLDGSCDSKNDFYVRINQDSNWCLKAMRFIMRLMEGNAEMENKDKPGRQRNGKSRSHNYQEGAGMHEAVQRYRWRKREELPVTLQWPGNDCQ